MPEGLQPMASEGLLSMLVQWLKNRPQEEATPAVSGRFMRRTSPYGFPEFIRTSEPSPWEALGEDMQAITQYPPARVTYLSPRAANDPGTVAHEAMHVGQNRAGLPQIPWTRILQDPGLSWLYSTMRRWKDMEQQGEYLPMSVRAHPQEEASARRFAYTRTPGGFDLDDLAGYILGLSQYHSPAKLDLVEGYLPEVMLREYIRKRGWPTGLRVPPVEEVR